MKPLIAPVAAMLVQQALATMAPLSISVVGPVVVAAFGLSPGYIGGFVAATFAVSMASSLASGGAIARYGALRLSQLSLLFCAGGLAVAAGGLVAAFLPAALLLGIGSGPATPASSHILARLAPPRLAPLVFSIKQTGVPLGGILAGTLIPVLLDLADWQGALLVSAALYLALAALMQPLRARIDDDRDPRHRITVRGAARTFRHVVRDRGLRELAVALCLYTGLQLTFGSYFVAYLVDGLGFGLAFAGMAFAVGQATGFCGRILWGWVASRLVAPRVMLVLLGAGMAAAAGLFALIGAGWPRWAVVALAMAYGATGIGFQGILLSEVARRAPEGAAGAVTGAVAVFAYAGMTSFPAMVGVIVGATGSYEAGFLAAAALTVPATLLLAKRRPRAGNG